MQMKLDDSSKVQKPTRLGSALVSGAACLVALFLVTTPANDAVTMIPGGYLICLMPFVFAPIQYLLILAVFNCASSSRRLLLCVGYVTFFLILCIVPLMASDVAGHLALGFVDIPRERLTPSDIQALQDMQTQAGAFPFEVRFSWQTDRVRVVFRKQGGREQLVRSALGRLSLPSSR